MSLVEFLLARIREDELDSLPFRNELGEDKRWAAEDTGGAVRYAGVQPFGLPDLLARFETNLEAEHVGRWDPARALAECAAKRSIISSYEAAYAVSADNDVAMAYNDGECEALDRALRALAAVYATHPDYRKEWAL